MPLLCFHAWERCVYCWPPSGIPPPPPSGRLRCAACGRFRKPGPASCGRCHTHPLSLFATTP